MPVTAAHRAPRATSLTQAEPPAKSGAQRPPSDVDKFERKGAPELTWLAPAVAQYTGEASPPTALTYVKAAGKAVVGFFGILATIGALGVLALLQGAEDKRKSD